MTESVSYQDKPWLKHYENGIPETIQFEETCIPAFLDRSAKEFPEHTALLFQGFKVTYRQLNDMVNRFSACLSGFGIKKATVSPSCSRMSFPVWWDIMLS